MVNAHGWLNIVSSIYKHYGITIESSSKVWICKGIEIVPDLNADAFRNRLWWSVAKNRKVSIKLEYHYTDEIYWILKLPLTCRQKIKS